MARIGQFNHLKIARKTSKGTFLHAGEFGQVFLPANQTPSFCEVGDRIEVFLYRDSHDQAVATTHKPRVEIGGVACLKVVSVSSVGAFLDWGLPKDLLVPFGEQSKKMAEGEFHLVRVYEDNTGRVCASSKLNKFIKPETQGLKTGQQVSLFVGDKTDIGYKMIVEQKYWGVLHSADVFREIRYGQRLKGFIKNVRADKRVDISLQEPGYAPSQSLSEKIIGFSPVYDKSPPELIYKTFGVSKKVFKAELGSLYKQRKIVIESEGIRLA
jgi:uncharacterized protein